MQKTSEYKSSWHPFTENPLDIAFNQCIPTRQDKSSIALNAIREIDLTSQASLPNSRPIPSQIHHPRRIPKEVYIQLITSEKTSSPDQDKSVFSPDKMSAYINTAKNEAKRLWIEGNILQAEQTLLDCIRNLPYWYHNFDAEDLLHHIYLLQNKKEQASELIDYLLQLDVRTAFPYLKKIENSYMLSPRNFSLLVEHLKTISHHIQDPLISFAAAKYYLITLNKTPAHDRAQILYLHSQFKESLYIFLTKFPAGKTKIEYLETLAKETGSSFFLVEDLLRFLDLEHSKKTDPNDPRQTEKAKHILYPLLYAELAAEEPEQLKSSYESALLADPLSFNDHLQYIKFLIRHGDIDASLTQINDCLAKPTMKKSTKRFTLLKAELLISQTEEVEAMRLITEEVTSNSKNAPLWIEKARLHLNPLSRFYDLEKARESLLFGKQAHQYPDVYLGEWRLAFISKANPSEPKNKLSLLSHDFFGTSYLLSLGDPEASTSQKIDAFFTQIENWLTTTSSIYEARTFGSLEDALAEARRLYPNSSDDDLYQLLSSPLGLNKRTLHCFGPVFTSSQKIATVLGF
jgi:hypothetical protein